jgi:adenosylhomocysteine nucleosidase
MRNGLHFHNVINYNTIKDKIQEYTRKKRRKNMIGAVIAMQSEAEILLNEMSVSRYLTVSGKKVYVGTAYGKNVALCVCGVGKVNAALGTQLLVSKFDVEKIINFGVSGGLNASTKLCNVYQISAAVQFDFDLVQLNGGKIGTLNEYSENYLQLNMLNLPFEKRKLGTADRFNDSPADFALLTEELNADIRDMEGAAIVQAAYAAELPVYSIKAISDVAGSGSTTEQFLVNKDKALENLKAVLPHSFDKL